MVASECRCGGATGQPAGDDVLVLSDVRGGRDDVRWLPEGRLIELRSDPGEHLVPGHVVLRGKLYKRPGADRLASARPANY